jgi:hypothetical protein
VNLGAPELIILAIGLVLSVVYLTSIRHHLETAAT